MFRSSLTVIALLHATATALAQVPAPVPPAPVDPLPEAADDPPSAADDPAADELSPEDLAELEAATGADIAEATPQPSGLAALGNVIMNPELSFIMDVAAAYDSEAGLSAPLELEMAIGKAVDPYFRFDGNVAFSDEGAEIEEAYATTLALPHDLQARAGQFLTRFGRINPTHPHTWDFVDRPLSGARVFGDEGLRGAGVELSWLSPLPWFVELVGAVQQPPIGAIDRAQDLQLSATANQFFELSDDWSLLWGLSFTTGPNGAGAGKRTDVAGTDLYLKWRPITRQSAQQVTVQTEWLYRAREAAGKTYHGDVDGYAQATWRFAQRWSTGARWEYGSGADAIALDDLDPLWTEDRHRVTADATFYPTEFSRLRLQASVDHPAWADPVLAGFLALEISAGVHGAHKF